MENAQKDNVSLLQIRIFLSAAETGSFSLTAQRLYLTQPTVSKWMAKLEGQLGCRLFTRQGNGVQLTKQGKILLDKWQALVEVYDSSISELEEQEGHRRVLRMGVLSQLRFLPLLGDLQRRFCAEHPDVDVALEVYDLREMRQRLLHGDLDAAFIYSFDFDRTDGLSVLSICKAELFLYGMPEVLEDPEAEGYHTLLCVSRGESRRGGDLAIAACRDMGFQFEKVRYFPNVASVELAARQSKGVMIAGGYVYQRNDPMMRFPVPKEIISNNVSLAWIPGGEKTATLDMIRCVEEYIAEQ